MANSKFTADIIAPFIGIFIPAGDLNAIGKSKFMVVINNCI